jgi:hypothetical protein
VEVLLLLSEHDTKVRKRSDDFMTFTLGILAADLSSSIIYGDTYHTVTKVWTVLVWVGKSQIAGPNDTSICPTFRHVDCFAHTERTVTFVDMLLS